MIEILSVTGDFQQRVRKHATVFVSSMGRKTANYLREYAGIDGTYVSVPCHDRCDRTVSK